MSEFLAQRCDPTLISELPRQVLAQSEADTVCPVSAGLKGAVTMIT